MFTFYFSFIDFIDFTVRVVIFLRFKVDIGTEVMHTAARPVRRAHGNVFESAVNMRNRATFKARTSCPGLRTLRCTPDLSEGVSGTFVKGMGA